LAGFSWLLAAAWLFVEDFSTEDNTFVADVDAVWPSDEARDLILVFPTEGAKIGGQVWTAGVLRRFVWSACLRGWRFFSDDLLAEGDAFVADEDVWPGDEARYPFLGLVAKRAAGA
jgi:hypothetical protein